MIETSDKYNQIMASNVRPKCEPVITVEGVDNEGNAISLVWKAKDIKSMTYKRGIDPTGAEAPYMELTWTEIYKGKLNAQSYPEKYNNIAKYMSVKLEFHQYLSFYSTWRDFYETNTLWSTLFNIYTWRNVRQSAAEVVKVPTLFLEARPTIKGNTITWKARDLLSFFSNQQLKSFNINGYPLEDSSISFVNAMCLIILNERAAYLEAPSILSAITNTVDSLLNMGDTRVLDKPIIVNGSTNDFLVNYANIQNLFLNFKDDTILPKDGFNPTDYKFSKKVLYGNPTITNGTNISAYKFKNYRVDISTYDMYIKAPVTKTVSGVSFSYWYYDDYGTMSQEVLNDTSNSIYSEINYAVALSSEAIGTAELQVFPIKYNGYENNIKVSGVGEAYVEDNPIYPYDSTEEMATKRLEWLSGYFNERCSSLEFQSLANPAIEPGDVVQVETNLYSDTGEAITKTAVIVELTIEYIGAVKEKIKAHEVSI